MADEPKSQPVDQNPPGEPPKDPPKQDPPATPPVDVTETVQKGIDAARKKDDVQRIHDSLGHLKRTNPEGYKELVTKFGIGGEGEDVTGLRKELEDIKLEKAREKSLRRYKLDDDDEMFLTSATPEGIEAQAKALRAKYDKLAPKGDDSDDNRSTLQKNKTDLPDHSGKPRDLVEVSKQQLVEIAHQRSKSA